MDVRYFVLDERLQFSEAERFCARLPMERREKIARFRFERDKLRSLIAGLLIDRFAGCELTYGRNNKPYLARGGVFFSVSHSGDIVAIAIDSAEVGCDVERIPTDNRLKIADRFFHPNERGYVNASADKNRAFCRVWTRKEAYLKMTGEGIAADLTAFDTTSAPLSEQLFSAELDGYFLSVCSEKPISADDVHISEIEIKELLK